MKRALITGASSGIGKDIAIYLSNLGYELYVVARRTKNLEKLKSQLNKEIHIISLDLSNEDNCFKLYEKLKNENISVLVNNAGFGDFGYFYNTDINKEISMINVNIKCVHILTKLFLKDMMKNNYGYILNISSAAAFAPGPLMATYYSSKSYVYRLSESINRELKYENSNVHLSVLCPGPVDTEFNEVANVKFSIKPLKSNFVAKYAIDNMFKNKCIIIPGVKMKIARFLSKIINENIIRTTLTI